MEGKGAAGDQGKEGASVYWPLGCWAIYSLEWPCLGVKLYTADSAGRLSSTSWERLLDARRCGDRDEERQIAGGR